MDENKQVVSADINHLDNSSDNLDNLPNKQHQEIKKKNKPLNTTGHNQRTNDLPDFPYSMRFAYAQVLLEKGSTWEEITSLTGICKESIRRLKNGLVKVNDALVEKLRGMEVNKISYLLHRVIDSVSIDDLEKAGLSQKMVATGILIDKRALLEGKPTVRVEFTGQNDIELEKKIAEKEAELDKWKAGEIVNAEADISTLTDENESK